MGLLNRWDRSNQATMEQHREVARDGVRVSRGAVVVLAVAGGAVLVTLLVALAGILAK